MSVKIKFKKLIADAIVPYFKYAGDAGLNLCSGYNYVLQPGKRELIKTGLSCEFPFGYELQIRSRSGMALNNGVVVLNSPGTVDAGYRGELGVILQNFGDKPYLIEKGDKVAQAILKKLEEVVVEEVDELTSTERDAQGFGSSGVKNG
jgi:dUTP pyrophosphatase